MKKAALLSVSNRAGLIPFAKTLYELNFELLATSGTGKCLSEGGIPWTSIADYTGQPEILNGRVKTLHPKIHAGLLACQGNPEHLAELESAEILPIGVAVVNLYPFVEHLHSDAADDANRMVELIDIGGPTMIRAAAKNFASVFPVMDPSDYQRVGEVLKTGHGWGEQGLSLRRELAVKVFTELADYNLQIARYFSEVTVLQETLKAPTSEELVLPEVNGVVLRKAQDLRYGENPQQRGTFYRALGSTEVGWKQLQGKDLSYNNFLDFDAACRIIRMLPRDQIAAVILKHLNPCGAAVGDSLTKAISRAKAGDPRSHFGGIIGVNYEVDQDAANNIVEDFAEIIVAPAFSPAALKVLEQKKNLRLICINLEVSNGLELRSVAGGVLLQEPDAGVCAIGGAQLVSERQPSPAELADLQFAWLLCAHVKSNAITLVQHGMLLASGAGQMSRIDAAELALTKARTHGHNTDGAVAGSDAFFPFPDCIESLAGAGIKAVIAPSGSRQDQESIAAANRCGISLLFAPERHFRH